MTPAASKSLVLAYAAHTPLLLPLRTAQLQETSVRSAVKLAFLAIQQHGLGVPAYDHGRCINHAAKIGDAVMAQFWDGFVRASDRIEHVRAKLTMACAAPTWDDFITAEQAVPRVPKATAPTYITDAMLARAMAAAEAKLKSLPAFVPPQATTQPPARPEASPTADAPVFKQPDLFE